MKVFVFMLAISMATYGQATKEHLVKMDAEVEIGSTDIETPAGSDHIHWRCRFINEGTSHTEKCNGKHPVFGDISSNITLFKPKHLKSKISSKLREVFELKNVEIYFGDDQYQDSYHSEKIVIKAVTDLPVHVLADEVIPQLNTDIYRHVFWTHNFDRYNNFFPNVGAHMRKRRDMLTERRDLIAAYILKKHATTFHTEGGAPTDYAMALHDACAQVIHLKAEDFDTLSISDVLIKAREAEMDVIGLLTEVLFKADAIGDHELGEFITADVMPGILKSTKSLENDIQILESFKITAAPAVASPAVPPPVAVAAAPAATTSQTEGSAIEHLADYLFDKTNY